MTRRSIIPIALAILAIGGSVAYGALSLFAPGDARADEAARIVSECKGAGAPCYEKEIPALFPALPIPAIFDIVRDVRRLDPSYQFCHVAAHKLGELAVAEDPAKWLDVIPLNPSDGLCSNGFIHGIIVGRFRNDTLDSATLEKTLPDFARACEPRPDWQPSRLDQAMCYHGMGHLFMFITNADIRTSLASCARISDSPGQNFMFVCREGVFMQIYQPLEPDDFALLDLLPEKPTRENYRRLCAAYEDDEDEGACLREAWPFWQEEVSRGDIAAFCSGQPNMDEEEKCWTTATTIIGRQSLGDLGAAERACAAVPALRQPLCYSVVAQALIEEDRSKGAEALAFCGRAPASVANECVDLLASRARWIFTGDAPEKERFCALLSGTARADCES